MPVVQALYSADRLLLCRSNIWRMSWKESKGPLPRVSRLCALKSLQQLTHRWTASSTEQSHVLCTGAVGNETSSIVLLKEGLGVYSQCDCSLPTAALTRLVADTMPVCHHLVCVCFCWYVPTCGRACMHTCVRVCMHMYVCVHACVPVRITAIMIIPSSLPLAPFLAMRRGGH